MGCKLVFAIIFLWFFFSCNEENKSLSFEDEQFILATKDTTYAEEAFVSWANRNAQDLNMIETSDFSGLEILGKAINDAKIVAISEGFHNGKEVITLNHRLIKYLVQEKGFNTVIFESGFPESKKINDFIHGKNETNEVWTNGICSMYSEWKEGRGMFRWMKKYNAKHNGVLDVYGIDIAGEYKNWKSPLMNTLSYLKRVDPNYQKELALHLNKYMELLSDNAYANYFNKLSKGEKFKLDTTLKSVLNRFEENKTGYIAKSDSITYAWEMQSITALNQASNYYQNIMDRWKARAKYVGLNGREISMAHNFNWVYNAKKDAKIILVSHVIHNKTKTHRQNDMYGYFTPTNQMLKEKYKDSLFIVGMSYGGGYYWKNWYNPSNRIIDTIPNFKANGLENTLEKVSKENYYLILNDAPQYAQPYLNRELQIRENDYFINLEPNEWDAIIYIDSVNPATPY